MIKIVNKIEEADYITHSGTMHADEVFSTAFLHLYRGDILLFRTNEVKESDYPDKMIYDIVGWIGMIIVLIAYALLSTDKIKNGILYQSLNLIAGILMAIGLFPKNAWFSFTLQIIWAIIALITIIKIKK